MTLPLPPRLSRSESNLYDRLFEEALTFNTDNDASESITRLNVRRNCRLNSRGLKRSAKLGRRNREWNNVQWNMQSILSG